MILFVITFKNNIHGHGQGWRGYEPAPPYILYFDFGQD